MTEEKADNTPNTGVDDESTVNGGYDKEHTEGVIVKTHGGKYAEKTTGEEDCHKQQLFSGIIQTHKS